MAYFKSHKIFNFSANAKLNKKIKLNSAKLNDWYNFCSNDRSVALQITDEKQGKLFNKAR